MAPIQEVDELFETPSADPPTEYIHQDPLLTMAHDSLRQPEILDSSDITQLLSLTKSTTHKDSEHTTKVNRQYVFARANKAATQCINRGANASLSRSDMCLLQEMSHKMNVVGINDHELTALPIFTASVILQTNLGPIVGISHEYSHLGQRELDSCLWSA